MKTSLLVLGTGLAAGLVGFALATSSRTPDSPRVARSAEPAPAESGGVEDRLRELSREVAQLRSQLGQLAERQTGLEERAAVTRSLRTPAPVLEGIDELETVAMTAQPGESPAELEARILAVLQAKEDEVSQERDERRRVFLEDRLNERMLELEKELNLTGRQSESMRSVLAEEQIGRDAFFQRMREDQIFDRDTVRETMRELHQTASAELKQILDPYQFERYQEMEDRDAGRRGPGDGREGRGERPRNRTPR